MHCQNGMRSWMGRKYGMVLLFFVTVGFGTSARGQNASDSWPDSVIDPATRSTAQIEMEFPEFECGYRSPVDWLDEVRAAVARGEIADPATRLIQPMPPGGPGPGSTPFKCLSTAHIFPYEDTDQLLLTNFSIGELIDFMVQAANELLATHGDLYDFIGYWVNFTPHHQIGTAFYMSIENDVAGIGREFFNLRPEYGLGGDNIECCMMFWQINSSYYRPGFEPEAFNTRITLGHEYAHRFATFLPDLLDGRRMEGYGGFGCYDAGHWNQQVDGQGSALGIAEWVGSNPAVPLASYPDFYLFNTDIGGLFAYTELYLMGYVSPAEMDAGNSELRYMDNWDCVSGDYYGPISTFSSADIIAAAGPRVPDFTAEDKHYRTGWIMIHQPGDPPSRGELKKAVAIAATNSKDWKRSTLTRGTMDNSLFNDCNCNGIPDEDDIAYGTSEDNNGNGIPDECE